MQRLVPLNYLEVLKFCWMACSFELLGCFSWIGSQFTKKSVTWIQMAFASLQDDSCQGHKLQCCIISSNLVLYPLEELSQFEAEDAPLGLLFLCGDHAISSCASYCDMKLWSHWSINSAKATLILESLFWLGDLCSLVQPHHKPQQHDPQFHNHQGTPDDAYPWPTSEPHICRYLM